MSSVVLDASAILCVMRKEPGAEKVIPHLPTAIASAVNLSEVFAKAKDVKMTLAGMKWVIEGMKFTAVPFDEEQAFIAGSLRESTRDNGLSLGDRACLALGWKQKLPVLTTEKDWRGLDVGVKIRHVR